MTYTFRSLRTVVLAFVLALVARPAALNAATPPDEGMWIPLLLTQNHAEMQRLGLRLTAEQLYSVNNSSLKDAIVSLGGFCTAEVISNQGLLLTNHHCAYDAIQTHSTPEHDYLTDGFWAMNQSQELNVPGLTVAFLHEIKNVSEEMATKLQGITDETARTTAVQQAAAAYTTQYGENGKYRVDLKEMYYGGEYYLYIYKVYRDVRLVGAPPSAIGKFGGDTDNWMWPRHTGDFSLLRVYAGADNEPADYATTNRPLTPRHSLPVSLRGVQQNDFSMILGFPGRTERYVSSWDIQNRAAISSPARIGLRGERLRIMKQFMDQSDAVRIQYSSKYAQIANYWKYFIGQNKGLTRLRTVEVKQENERRFQEWANADATRRAKYGTVLASLERAYNEVRPYELPNIYLVEGIFGIESVTLAGAFQQMATLLDGYDANDAAKKAQLEALTAQLSAASAEHFKDFYYDVDLNLCARMLEMYYKDVPAQFHPQMLKDLYAQTRGDWMAAAKKIMATSIFTNKERLAAFLAAPKLKTLQKDMVYKLFDAFMSHYRTTCLPARTQFVNTVKGLNRLFIQGLREMQPDRTFFPDANSSMRLTYGTVQPYDPADAVAYDLMTTHLGILEKWDDANEEFVVPAKLIQLLKAGDFGQYGVNQNGTNVLPVCFLSTNDITGGNSGSPVINGNGELIGLAFDGNWEAMTGDLVFDAELKRTINVDIRYVLFIIDKYAGASNLIQEMNLVR